MAPHAADSPFHSRLAQQPLQLRVFLQPHRVCVPGQEGTQVFVLGSSSLLRRDGAAREKWRYRRGQGQEREQEPDRPNCIIFHNLKVSLSLSFVNGLPDHPHHVSLPRHLSTPTTRLERKGRHPGGSYLEPRVLSGLERSGRHFGHPHCFPLLMCIEPWIFRRHPHLDRGHPWALTASSPKVQHTWPFPARERGLSDPGKAG